MALHRLLYFSLKLQQCWFAPWHLHIYTISHSYTVSTCVERFLKTTPSSVILLEDSEDSTCSHTCDHGLLQWKNLKQNQQNKSCLGWSLGKTICKLQSLFPVESCSVQLTPPATRMTMHVWDVTIQESTLETGIQGFLLGLVVWAPRAW